MACLGMVDALAGIADCLGNAFDKGCVAPRGRALNKDVVAQNASQRQRSVDDLDVVGLDLCGAVVNFVGHVVVSLVGLKLRGAVRAEAAVDAGRHRQGATTATALALVADLKGLRQVASGELA